MSETVSETPHEKAQRVHREIVELLEREGCIIVAGEVGAVTGTFHAINGLLWTVGTSMSGSHIDLVTE